MNLWRPPLRNIPHRERCWLEACLRAHDSFCGCPSPIVHFSSLVARFNLQGGPPPEDDSPQGAPVLRALPAPSPHRHTRTENPSGEPWPTPTGGAAGGGRGEADGGAGGAADEYRAEDLDDLFAAIEGDQ
nr:ORF2 [Torque teno virus]